MVIRRIALAFVIASGFASDAAAQTPSADLRWAPWLGCWQLLDEIVQDPASLTADPSSRAGDGSRGTLVCVEAADGGARLKTVAGGATVLEETVIASGERQPMTEPDCRGWHRAEWSQLGARLFAQAELVCAQQPLRRSSGLSMMMSGPVWIDVQLIESDDRKSLRVRRYRRAPSQRLAAVAPEAFRSAPRVPLPSRLSVADVNEAYQRVAPEALQAALVELKSGFDLNAAKLLELDRAGLPDEIIDLMVALTFPEKFVVERNASAGGSWGAGGFDPMWPYITDPFFYTSYYAPFGYRYWGYYDPFYFQGPGFVTVRPDLSPRPSGDGRVVDGRGYTRVRRNDPDTTSSSGGAWTSGDRSGGGGSSGGGVSSSGYSGGSGGSGGRTAQPRPPGQ
jgi:hypothetical protein